MNSRVIHSESGRLQTDIADLLEMVFVAELLSPSRCIWLISPWISDVVVVRNRTARFAALEPTWEPRDIRLVEVLTQLTIRGADLRVALRPGDHNERFLDQLRISIRNANTSELVDLSVREELHEKGLLGDSFYLSGSMNITHNGIYKLDEAVRFETDSAAIASTRLVYHNRWGGRLPRGNHG